MKNISPFKIAFAFTAFYFAFFVILLLMGGTEGAKIQFGYTFTPFLIAALIVGSRAKYSKKNWDRKKIGLHVFGAVCLLLFLQTLGAQRNNSTVTGDKEVLIGLALHEQGKPIEAIAAFETATTKQLQRFSKYEIFNQIGNCYFEIGDFNNAQQAYSRSLAENPDQHNIWVGKGVALRKLGRLEETKYCYEKALQIKPDHADLHSNLGVLYLAINKPYDAVKSFEKAIELNPNEPTTHGNYASALGLTGNLPQAYEELEIARKLGYQNIEYVRENLDRMKSQNKLQPEA